MRRVIGRAACIGIPLLLLCPIARADDLAPLPPPSASAAPPPAPKPVTKALPSKAKPATNTKKPGRGVWRSFRAGADLIDSVPTAAVLEGAWSIALHLNTEFVSRTWDAPYPFGTIGQYSTRLLYGFTWTLMLGFESLGVLIANQGNFDWLAEAAFRSDWVITADLPACPRPGALGGCGTGVGTFSFIQIRPLRTKWWYEAGGGWFQQRVLNDDLRTVSESAWVLTPFSAVRELHTDLDAPVAARAFVGPGVYFGLHNAHMHPTVRGNEIYDPPLHEMYVLDGGIGGGVRAEGRLILWQHFSLEADVVLAPFLIGGPADRVSRDVAPLDYGREGMSVWRRVHAGIGYEDPRYIPFKINMGVFGAELSDRPIERVGHRGFMLRFDIPLRVPHSD